MRASLRKIPFAAALTGADPGRGGGPQGPEQGHVHSPGAWPGMYTLNIRITRLP